MSADGWATDAVLVTVQPFESVTVTVYTPAFRPMMEGVVVVCEKLGPAHLKLLYGEVPPEGATVMALF